MRGLLLFAGGALSGAAATLAWTGDDAAGAPPPAPVEGGAAAAAGVPGADARLRAIERQLERLTALVERVGVRSVSAPVGGPVDRTSPPGWTGDGLVAALHAAERERLVALSDGELLAEGQRLLKRARDPVAAHRALTLLLDRPLEPAIRVQALNGLGAASRGTGDRAGAERAFREAFELGGPDGDGGAWAAYELALTIADRDDPASAMRFAQIAAGARDADEYVRVHGRWAVATLHEALGETELARARYRELLAAAQDRPDLAWLVGDVTRRLAALR